MPKLLTWLKSYFEAFFWVLFTIILLTWKIINDVNKKK